MSANGVDIITRLSQIKITNVKLNCIKYILLYIFMRSEDINSLDYFLPKTIK